MDQIFPHEESARELSSLARILDLEDEIGGLRPGMRADVIAVASDPREDLAAMERPVFVMKDGRVAHGGR